VGNAIKFTARGSVRLELTERQVNGRPMAALDVTDTGVGIKAEDLPRLFQVESEYGKGSRFTVLIPKA
jgi:signal transduction histidine kinase